MALDDSPDSPDLSPKSASSLKDSVHSQEALRATGGNQHQDDDLDEEQEKAARSLRTHEMLAFMSTFVLPALGAYLLHVIRGQLSAPSTGLVSDYNLSIFLLAAELRPVRQIIRLATNRTLHLQRIVAHSELSLIHI